MPDIGAEWVTADFWSGVARGLLAWVVTAGPRILLILLLTLVALRLLGWGCKALGRRAVRLGGRSSGREQEKRVETLVGIVKTAGAVAVWTVAGMLLLMQVGVNVAPLIAGAGIVGLAVGFGAQDLVRDVITGFFILLENQVRKGDVAIINGTGGLVENIGLRTIVLRDMSGTVHVFQNGKVETLANMTKEWSAIVLDIQVAYSQDTDQVAAGRSSSRSRCSASTPSMTAPSCSRPASRRSPSNNGRWGGSTAAGSSGPSTPRTSGSRSPSGPCPGPATARRSP